jgi:protein TonB
MKKSYRGFFLILLLAAFLLSPLLRGAENIVVQLRLYEGFKRKGKISAVVVSTYYLKKLAKEQILSDIQIEKEKQSLQKIYNLEDVENISIINMALRQGGENVQEEIMLAGRKLAIKLSMFAEDNNRFTVTVREKEKKIALMETEIIIPQEKTAVLGFADATKRIFFFSFHRKKNTPVETGNKRIAYIRKPRLIKKVVPVYPEQAIAEGVEGYVTVRAVIDESGSILRLEVEQGLHPLLDKAALDAVKQWKYKPLIMNDVARTTEVLVKIFFKIKAIPDRNE